MALAGKWTSVPSGLAHRGHTAGHRCVGMQQHRQASVNFGIRTRVVPCNGTSLAGFEETPPLL